ncbi:S-adenosyl-L-methionine-dependent methyltransferase [Stachybotrys elegans]|uniref:S-adenosyl-L-methionine-dependent methyltransferase n=1 Tax=Stachybotrys elegans TaxID=80388 RepID=A0A8K0SMA3_9HYPO|nr:S-adenosyl-L-methionine-dependent methyltransferase [Stachybotrys elegans]
MAEDQSSSTQGRLGPPSPVSTSSAIAVGSISNVAVIQSIEQGTFVSDGDPDDDTRSLTESIRQHIVDGGLRYHAYHAGQYAFPNDETEQHREDLKHHLILYLCDNNYFYAPVKPLLEEGIEVLDLGTGTGKWCMELADTYPATTFHGMDLSPIQPDWVPENVLFVVDDIEHEGGWTYGEERFDYIHIRHTIHSIRNRPQMWERIYEHLKPGGYVEIQEFHYTIGCDDDSCDGPYAFRDFLRYLRDGMAALGADLDAILHVEGELRAAGFQDICSKQLKCPNGPWPKRRRLQECGHILRDTIMWGLNGFARRPFRDGLNWTLLQIEMFLVDVRKSLSEEVNGNPKYHDYFPLHNIYARKPLNAQQPPDPATAATPAPKEPSP